MFKQNIIKLLKKHTSLKEIPLEIPPSPELGDYAFPCFILSKTLKKSPNQIAESLAKKIPKTKHISKITATGPYLNFFINKQQITNKTINDIFKNQKNKSTKKKILIESPGPNTNKPLHLGHVRNICLSQTLNNILKFQGNNTIQININNDRGIHICKSMLAYQKYGKNSTPKTAKLKSDFFIGKYYVLFAQKIKDNQKLETEVNKLLEKWENNDPKTIALWKKMNSWAYQGFKETYKKFNLTFDKEYYESKTYKKGKAIVHEGLKKRIFYKDKSGAIIIDLEKQGYGEKVLLRSNGTSVYVTQDMYLAKARYDDYKFDKLIYVVATEQNYHFKVLFEILKKLKYPFADKLHHFAYGMVNLTTGKMKSREGTVIDADNLIQQVEELAKKEIQKRHKLSKIELNERAKKIAMAAIRFYLIKHDPIKDMLFDPKKSISFEGETGPYVQYAYARINSIIKKSKQTINNQFLKKSNLTLLKEPQEINLIKKLEQFPKIINKISENYKLSLLPNYLLELSQEFNTYYHNTKIIQKDIPLQNARLCLIYSIKKILKKGLNLLEIKTLGEM